MNIQEAATCVRNGECTAAVSLATGRQFAFSDMTDGFYAGTSPRLEEICGDWELVNPIPKTEEVVIKGYVWPNSNEFNEGICSPPWIPATLTYSRPVKRKMMKREYYMLYRNLDSRSLGRFPDHAKLFAEWPEDEI